MPGFRFDKIFLEMFSVMFMYPTATPHRVFCQELSIPIGQAMGMDDEPPMKKKKGGINQRLQQAGVGGNKEESNFSALGEALLQKWAWGQYSPQQVQFLASKEVQDSERAKVIAPADLAFMASLETSGAHKTFT